MTETRWLSQQSGFVARHQSVKPTFEQSCSLFEDGDVDAVLRETYEWAVRLAASTPVHQHTPSGGAVLEKAAAAHG